MTAVAWVRTGHREGWDSKSPSPTWLSSHISLLLLCSLFFSVNGVGGGLEWADNGFIKSFFPWLGRWEAFKQNSNKKEKMLYDVSNDKCYDGDNKVNWSNLNRRCVCVCGGRPLWDRRLDRSKWQCVSIAQGLSKSVTGKAWRHHKPTVFFQSVYVEGRGHRRSSQRHGHHQICTHLKVR